jgi:hypothetical protein
MLSTERKVATYSYGCNIYPIVIVAPTGFSELPVREGLRPVYPKSKRLKVFLDVGDTVHGDNNIIPVNAYLSRTE